MNDKWFLVTLIIESTISEVVENSLTCEEQIRLVRADGRDTAYNKAIILGQAEEHSYLNQNGQTVAWKFVGLEDIEELDNESFSDGDELRSRFFRHAKPDSLVRHKDKLSIYLAHQDKTTKDCKVISERQPIEDE